MRNNTTETWLTDIALPHRSNKCLIFPFAKINGYGVAWESGGPILAHRFVCSKIHGNPPTTKHEAAHSCKNKACVNALHLRWATHAENLADTIAHGTSNRGQKHGMARLTTSDVLKIRTAKGFYKIIAQKYGISESAVGLIKRRKRWRWL